MAAQQVALTEHSAAPSVRTTAALVEEPSDFLEREREARVQALREEQERKSLGLAAGQAAQALSALPDVLRQVRRPPLSSSPRLRLRAQPTRRARAGQAAR